MSCDLNETEGGLRLYGFLGSDRVQADIVMVDDTVHVFTNVRLYIKGCVHTQYIKGCVHTCLHVYDVL